MAWYEKIEEMTDALIKLDEKLGIKKILQYLILVLFIIGLCNIRSITKWTIETVNAITEEIHNEQMEKRDQLLLELVPELREFLGATNADRILYLEYHNSKENLVGIPFKYIDLILQSSTYGVPAVPIDKFQDINVGNLTQLYEDLKCQKIVVGTTEAIEKGDFLMRYPGNHEFLMKNDGSTQQIFITIPGIHQPVGMIILEWMDKNEEVDIKRVCRESIDRVSAINGLIMKYV